MKDGYRSVSGMTDQKGTPLKSHSCQGPPDSASHGVPTASTAQPNPVCGDTKTEHASTYASCSRSGRSTARTTFPAAAAIRSSPSVVAELDVRPSRSSFATRQNTASGNSAASAPAMSSHDATDG